MSTANSLDTKVHYHIIRGLIDDGRAPRPSVLAELTGASADHLADAMKRLEASHSIVCHPGNKNPWVIHPFSLSPTATWVQGHLHGWWAPCIWCAIGVAALVKEDVVIHSRIGGEAEDVDIHVIDGAVPEDNLVTHFAVPLQSAWHNVHHYCATVLPFRSAEDVDAWSERHAIPRGAVVPIRQVAELARVWYGKHADPDWQKWSIEQAREIFNEVGLTGPFWALDGSGSGERF